MDRREFLAGLCLCCFTGAAKALPFRLDEGVSLMSPCKTAMPTALREHEIVRAAWEGLDARKVWDTHAHLLGDGQSGSGCWINPKMQSIFYPTQFLQRKFLENGACVDGRRGEAAVENQGAAEAKDKTSMDDTFVARLAGLIDEFPVGAGMLLFAFDHTYAEDGNRDLPRAAFHVPNDHALAISARFPTRFRAVASIHPYRDDAVEALRNAARRGAVAVKWLPSAMGIDPASPRCDAFYAAMAELKLPLITHAGQEKAVQGAHQQHFGNPLRLRRPLDQGVRVVVAHCASLGEDIDLDKGTSSRTNARAVPSFDLFERLMADPRYEKNLFGDISAMPQINRMPNFGKVVERDEWHSRLINGSDYPLPGVMPLFSVDLFVERGWITKSDGAVLKQIREYNPLLFDFVLKRRTVVKGKKLADSVFETAPLFAL